MRKTFFPNSFAIILYGSFLILHILYGKNKLLLGLFYERKEHQNNVESKYVTEKKTTKREILRNYGHETNCGGLFERLGERKT